jgi:hypothetical protein
MSRRAKILSAAMVGALAIVVTVRSADAVIDNKDQRKCLETVAKAGGKFLKAYTKEISKCADKDLKETGSCDTVGRDGKLSKAQSKLRATLDKKCGSQSPLSDLSLLVIGFPGKCPDLTGPPFTNDDLEDCIYDTHRTLADELLSAEFGSNVVDPITQLPPTPPDLGKCQKEIFKNGQKFVLTILKEVQKCRNGLNSGKISGFAPAACADDNNTTYPKAHEKIAKAESKLRDKIVSKCSDAQIAALDICDTGGGGVSTKEQAADCIVDSHRAIADNPTEAAPADLIDIEYAQLALCGDNIQNDPLATTGKQGGNYAIGYYPEECDGDDAPTCPGMCGAPNSDFPCLCSDTKRLRVVEHDNGDLDNGWTGISHDQKSIVEGSGYILDLYDCDDPDTICAAGPSCNNMPHQACAKDADCTGGGNFCRKRTTAVGAHCQQDVQHACTTNADCTGVTNFCRRTPASTPIGASAGGVAVCNLNLWSEDITGTHDVATGEGSLHLRRRALTYFGGGTLDQPCPVCGGFCNAPAAGSASSVGLRKRCTADADCFGVPTIGQPGTCVTAHVCSWGPSADKACRVDPPAGGNSVFFGTTSIDCLPPVGTDISSGGLDITTNAAVTGTTFLPPSFLCDAPGFGGSPGTADDKECILGSDTGKPCTADSQCTGGGTGSCAFRCFCPVGGTAQKPNACNAACVGGGSDAAACAANSDCPGGFCHPADCRDATSPPVCVGGTNNAKPCSVASDCPSGECGDFDSASEGFCTTGPIDSSCSAHTFRGCMNDADCRPPTCAYCDVDETCDAHIRQCFVNSGILRIGSATATERTTAAIFCIPGSGSASIDITGGFTGPGTSDQPMSLLTTGF